MSRFTVEYIINDIYVCQTMPITYWSKKKSTVNEGDAYVIVLLR